jgi:two-component system, OmpR family, response regulator TctD
MNILLVEDNEALQASLCRALERRGFVVRVCGRGDQALQAWADQEPEVVLLDLSLPGLDGLEVLSQARKAGRKTPVMILTARGTVGDRVLGLNTGADDYLAKPFDLDELEARLRALRRRSPASEPAVSYCGLQVDAESGAVLRHGRPLELAGREAAMLRALLARAGQAVAKERLFDLVFQGETDVHQEAVEVVAYRLRKRLQGTGVALVTLRGLGYLLRPAA